MPVYLIYAIWDATAIYMHRPKRTPYKKLH